MRQGLQVILRNMQQVCAMPTAGGLRWAGVGWCQVLGGGLWGVVGSVVTRLEGAPRPNPRDLERSALHAGSGILLQPQLLLHRACGL